MDLLPAILIVAPITIGLIVMNRRQRQQDASRHERHQEELDAAIRLAQLEAARERHRDAALEAVEVSRHQLPPLLP
jgi:hypothetical protein